MFCRVAAEALRHAGLDPFRLAGRPIGVYVGSDIYGEREIDLTQATFAEDTAALLRNVAEFQRLPPPVRSAVTGSVIDAIRRRKPGAERQVVGEGHCVAAIVADAMGLTGPAMALDAACSSSFYVLAAAGWALRQRRIDAAIVGGACCFIPDNLVYFSKVQCCSATGSRPFSSTADGMVGSEGYVAVVVKTLDRAEADGDRILAVVRGLGLSSDGRGKALWAPMAEGQVEAIRRAYPDLAEFCRVQYIEAHATSTQVGDAAEMASLATVTKASCHRAKDSARRGEGEHRPHARSGRPGGDRQDRAGLATSHDSASNRLRAAQSDILGRAAVLHPERELRLARAGMAARAARRSTPSASAGSMAMWFWRVFWHGSRSCLLKEDRHSCLSAADENQ